MKRAIIIQILSFLFFPIFSQNSYEDYVPSKSILTDDFSGTKNKWKVDFLADSSYTSKIADGYLEITSKYDKVYPIFSISKDINMSRDFEIEAEIQYIQGENNNALSLVWGKEENSYNRYIFAITGNGYYQISQYKGDWINLKNWINSELVKKDSYNKLTVRKIGSQYYFFLNENLVHTQYFTPLTGNQIGFQDNQNTTMRVRNLKVAYLKPKHKEEKETINDYSNETLRTQRWGCSISPLMGYIRPIGDAGNRWGGGWNIVDALGSYRFLPYLGIEAGLNVAYIKISKQNQVNVEVTNGYSNWSETIDKGVYLSCPIGLKTIVPVSKSADKYLILGAGGNYVRKNNETNIQGFKPVHSSGFGYYFRLAYFLRTEKYSNGGMDFQIRYITDSYEGTWVPDNVKATDGMLLFTIDVSFL